MLTPRPRPLSCIIMDLPSKFMKGCRQVSGFQKDLCSACEQANILSLSTQPRQRPSATTMPILSELTKAYIVSQQTQLFDQ